MNASIIFEVVILAVVIIAGVIIKILYKPALRGEKHVYNYKRKDFLMSRAEHEFFDILVGLLGNKYYVFPQIHLPNIIDNKVKGQSWKGAFRHIDEKSVDFVICDKEYIKPLLAIELDDRTHEREDRKKRDEEVERILTGAGMPFVRFRNDGHFDREEISRIIADKLK